MAEELPRGSYAIKYIYLKDNVFIMGYVTFSLGCYMVCCSVASLAVGYIFELFSFIFIRVLRPSLRPQNNVRW